MSEEPLDEYELDKLRLAQKKKKKKQQHTGGAKRLRNLEVFASSGSGRKAKAKSPIASGEDDRVNQWRLQLAEEQRQEEEEEERLRAVYQMQIRADEAAGKRSPSNSPMARSVGKRSPKGAASSAGSPLAASQSPGGASAGAAGADVGERFTGEFDWGEQGIGVESARLQQENADLAVALDQRAREVKRLEVVLQTMQPIPGLDPSALLDVLVNGERQEHDIRDLKIVEMAKKIRKVKAALERERATCTALRYEVQQVHLASDLAAVGRGEDAGAVSSARARNAVFGAASPRARAKINAAAEASASAKQQKQKKKQRPRASKEDEYRAKLLEARAEVKRTQRALSREEGPDVPIADVLASVGEADVMGGWRGRAQTITMLRTKLKHTKRKLAAASGERERSSMANDVDVQAVDDLKAMQAARDGAVEALTSQYGAVSTALEGAQEKLKHKKARIRTLEENQRRTKAQLKTMLQKSVNDDGLIDRLTKDAVAYRDAAQDGRRKGEKVILLEKAKGAAEDRARRAENALETSRRKLVAEEAAAQHLRGQVGAAALQQAQAAQASRSGQAVAVRVLQVRGTFSGCARERERRRCGRALEQVHMLRPAPISHSYLLPPHLSRRTKTPASASSSTRWGASLSAQTSASRCSKPRYGNTICKHKSQSLGRRVVRRSR